MLDSASHINISMYPFKNSCVGVVIECRIKFVYVAIVRWLQPLISTNCMRSESILAWLIIKKCINNARIIQGRHFNVFLGGTNFFFILLCYTGLLKNWRKQHFICSNLTSFIVPFFLSPFFSRFSFFLSFFLIYFFLGGNGPPAPPPWMTPLA